MAQIIIDFTPDGDVSFSASDLEGFSYDTILGALAASTQALISEAVPEDDQAVATQRFLMHFVSDVRVHSSEITLTD